MNPFDRALELHELDLAAVEYALMHGEPRTAAYRRAWGTFRQQVQTVEDLNKLRAANGPAVSGPRLKRNS
jgi:hypothetical protein